MADNSKIEWCDATWNPIVGCSRVSKGCENCYAERVAFRFKHLPKFGAVIKQNGHGWNGAVHFDENALLQPLKWKKPRRIFVCSMGDLFHEKVSNEWIDKVYAIMALCPQHTFMVLTKRPERMREYFRLDTTLPAVNTLAAAWDYMTPKQYQEMVKKPISWPLPNVWHGVSVEDQRTANERIPILLRTQSAIRFISAEPLLGEIDLKRLSQDFDDGMGFFVDSCLNGKRFNQEYGDYDNEATKLDWVIAGGESGKNARPMHPDWVRKLRDDCTAANVPFFFKQWGEWAAFDAPYAFEAKGFEKCCNGSLLYGHGPNRLGLRFDRVGKARAGNLLDGKQHLEFPKIGGE